LGRNNSVHDYEPTVYSFFLFVVQKEQFFNQQKKIVILKIKHGDNELKNFFLFWVGKQNVFFFVTTVAFLF